MLHGYDPNTPAILHALGLDPRQIDRFRDASFGKDGDAHVFHILCRTGGGNREDYPNTVLTSHPLYLRDHDDEYDCTYAHYYFRIPESVLAELKDQGLSLDDVAVTETLRDKTEAAIEAIKTAPVSPLGERGAAVRDAMLKAVGGESSALEAALTAEEGEKKP